MTLSTRKPTFESITVLLVIDIVLEFSVSDSAAIAPILLHVLSGLSWQREEIFLCYDGYNTIARPEKSVK